MVKNFIMTDAQIAARSEEERGFIEQGGTFLKEVAERLGYTKISDLPPNAQEKLSYNKKSHYNDKTGPFIYEATRSDGIKVYASIVILAGSSHAEFQASIISPVFYGDHAGNHDFNHAELEDTLQKALELPPFPEKK